MGDLQPLAPPDPLDPLVVDQPARLLQQPGDLAIAIAAVLPGQCDGVGGEPLFVFTAPRYLALRRAVTAWICSIQARRRAGLRSFPGHDQAACIARLQATSPRGVRACIRRVAGCATSTSFASHASTEAGLELTLHLDHPMGSHQFNCSTAAFAACCDSNCSST